MAKHVYEELEVDEHNIATHWINRKGVECWAVNEYKPNGRIKDVHIIRMKFPKGYENDFGHIYEEDTTFLFGQYDYKTGGVKNDIR